MKALLVKEIMQIPSRRKLAEFLRKNPECVRRCELKSSPDHASFSYFIKRLGKDIFQKILNDLVAQVKRLGGYFGKMVAIDSSLVKAYSRLRPDRGSSDPDAKMGIGSTKEWVFGYKLHLACDADSELPISMKVTPANVYDNTQFGGLIRDLISKGLRPSYVLADAGYDSAENRTVAKLFGAIPVIAGNPRRSRVIKAEPLPNYEKRWSVEHVFSRLKEELGLKMVKVGGQWRVTVHMSISVMALLSVAATALRLGRPELMTKISTFKF